MSQYITPYADIVGMIDALEAITRDRWNRWGKEWKSGDAALEVRECKTIGLHAGRQCGLTHGTLKWMSKHPDECILITKGTKLCSALEQTYLDITGLEEIDYFQLVPSVSGTIEKWNEQLPDDVKANTRFIVVDDAQFTVGAGYLKRADFNKWVAETFHPDTFVILIK